MPLHLFPVTIQVDGETYGPARFYGTEHVAQVWVWPNGKDPVLAVEAAGFVKQARGMGDRFADGTRAKWVLETVDGSWLASPTGGCGCSHPGKRFDPSKVTS